MSHDPQALLIPQAGGIPLPDPSHWSEPYWKGANEGSLRYQWCEQCALPQMDPRPACRTCLAGPLAWRDSYGVGTISSFTIVWRPPVPQFTVPYAPAIVELTEGFELLTNIIGCNVADVAVGMEVVAEFVEVAPNRSLPYFRPA